MWNESLDCFAGVFPVAGFAGLVAPVRTLVQAVFLTICSSVSNILHDKVQNIIGGNMHTPVTCTCLPSGPGATLCEVLSWQSETAELFIDWIYDILAGL
ncbi:hypothetical protein N657DRAFT_492934 [Parathielavia appendiculata]|uniref:Uncharacterized protein n=1 Tax=Parathielavia appendiculata TaxID=2587402 RepID=A0AAN6Z1R7_9PEZI|nr:hypothetical protein N657DRAFT_492934 [Parathielavia appendiculata]